MVFRLTKSSRIFSAFYSLTYREQEVIRSHMGFCPNCRSTKSPKYRPQTFHEIAIQNELTSAESTENIYHKAIGKMKAKLCHKEVMYPQTVNSF